MSPLLIFRPTERRSSCFPWSSNSFSLSGSHIFRITYIENIRPRILKKAVSQTDDLRVVRCRHTGVKITVATWKLLQVLRVVSLMHYIRSFYK